MQYSDLAQNMLLRRVNCIFVRQRVAPSWGHAVLCARPVIGEELFADVLEDDLMLAPMPITMRLVDVYNSENKFG